MAPPPRFPPEILADIFTLACAEFGHTGLILNLVCKVFRSVLQSTSADIQVVAVNGIEQLEGFKQMLDARAEMGVRPKVKKLLLSSIMERAFLCDEEKVTEYEERRVEYFRHPYLIEHRDEESENLSPKLIEIILNLVSADHLRILTIIIPDACPLPRLVPLSFPILSNLTIYDRISGSSFSGCPIAPRLQRLHIAYFESLPPNFDGTLATIAPNLVQLKISGIRLSRTATILLEILKSFVEQSAIDNLPDLPPSIRNSKFPRSLKRIEIGFKPFLSPKAWHTHPVILYNTLLHRFNNLALVTKDIEEPKLVIPNPKGHAVKVDKSYTVERDQCREVWNDWILA